MRLVVAALTFAALAAYATPAAAQSPRWVNLEIKFGPYWLQSIDDGIPNRPARSIFGRAPKLMTQAGLEVYLWDKLGTVGVQFVTGYWSATGAGIVDGGSGVSTGDTTQIHVLPFRALATYRADFLYKTYRVPLAPYAKFGPAWYLWWIENQDGRIARWNTGGGVQKAMGGTFGLDATVGFSVNLSSIDPATAREFDNEWGVNSTQIFFEYGYHWVNDFGSKASFDFSGHQFLGGVMFEL